MHVLTQIIAVLVLSLTYLYTNAFETKAIVPIAVVHASFEHFLTFQKDADSSVHSSFPYLTESTILQTRSDLRIDVSFAGPIREISAIDVEEDVVHRARLACYGISSLSHLHDNDDHEEATTSFQDCNPDMSVHTTNISFSGAAHNQPYLRCHFNTSLTTCTVTWFCPNCTLTHDDADVHFSFSPAHTASRFDVKMSASTGVHTPRQHWNGRFEIAGGDELQSAVKQAVLPSLPTELVFSGHPSTEFSFGLIPTYFESVELINFVVPSSFPVLKTGYHVRPDELPVRGNEIGYKQFPSYYDAPLRVRLVRDSQLLLSIRREFIQNIIVLVSSILSAAAGIAGGFKTMTNQVDKRQELLAKFNDLDKMNATTLGDEGEDEDKNESENEDDRTTIASSADIPTSPLSKFRGAAKSIIMMRRMGTLPRTLFNNKEETDNNDKMNDENINKHKTTTNNTYLRVLPLISHGMPIDLALKYHSIIKRAPSNKLLMKLKNHDDDKIESKKEIIAEKSEHEVLAFDSKERLREIQERENRLRGMIVEKNSSKRRKRSNRQEEKKTCSDGCWGLCDDEDDDDNNGEFNRRETDSSSSSDDDDDANFDAKNLHEDDDEVKSPRFGGTTTEKSNGRKRKERAAITKINLVVPPILRKPKRSPEIVMKSNPLQFVFEEHDDDDDRTRDDSPPRTPPPTTNCKLPPNEQECNENSIDEEEEDDDDDEFTEVEIDLDEDAPVDEVFVVDEDDDDHFFHDTATPSEQEKEDMVFTVD